MARKEGEYIAINELYGNLSNTASISKALRYNGGLGRRALLNGIVKFDHWITSLVVSDFSIGYEGGNVSDYIDVSSFGTDVVGENHNIDFSVNPSFISKNENNQEVSHTIEVTQFGSGEKVSVTCYQDSESVYPTGFRYEPYVSNTSIETASASGATLTLKIDGTVYIYRTYSDGSEEYYSKYDFSSVDAYVEYGYSFIGAEYSNGKVIVPSAGTDTYNGERVAFTISYYSYEVLGETYYEFPSINVYQEENKITGQEWGTSASDYSLSISSSVSSFTSKGGTSTISVQCQQRYRDVYTSLSKGEWKWGNGTASISTTYGSLNKSSITGKDTATLTVGKDYGTGTTAVVTANVGNGTKTANVSVTQAKRVEKETVYNQPTVTSTSIGKASVKGSTLSLSVSWSQTTTIKYDNDTTSEGTPYDGTSIATITNGSSTIGSKIVDGKVEVPSAKTSYYISDRTAFTITEYSYTAKSGTWDENANISVLQEKNGRTQKAEYEIVLGTPSSSIISNTGGTFSFSATSRYRYKYTYDSGDSNYSDYANASASVTYSNGVSKVSASSFSGTTTITATVLDNGLEQIRFPKVTVTSTNDSSVYKSVQVSQSAVEWVFTATTLNYTVAYNATSVTLTGISSRNGFYEDISKGDVYATGATVGTPTNSGTNTTFNIPISFSVNNSTTSKTITVVVTQPISGKKLTYTITQNGKPQDTDMINWQTNSGVYIPGAKYTFFGKLIYRNTITSNIVVQVLKNTSVISNQNIPPRGSYYNANYNIMDVTIEVLTDMQESDVFYLRATYGSDVAQIELIKSLNPL